MSKAKEAIMKLQERMNALEAKVENMPSSQGEAIAEAEQSLPSEEFKEKKNQEINERKSMSIEDEFDMLLRELTSSGKVLDNSIKKDIQRINEVNKNDMKQIPNGLLLSVMLLRAEKNINDVLESQEFLSNKSGIRKNSVIKALIKALAHTAGRLNDKTGFFSRMKGSLAEATGTHRERNSLLPEDDSSQNGGRKKTQRRRLKKPKGAKKTQTRKLKIHH